MLKITLQPPSLWKHLVHTQHICGPKFCSDVCQLESLYLSALFHGIPVVGSMEKYGWPCSKLYTRRALLPMKDHQHHLLSPGLLMFPRRRT